MMSYDSIPPTNNTSDLLEEFTPTEWWQYPIAFVGGLMALVGVLAKLAMLLVLGLCLFLAWPAWLDFAFMWKLACWPFQSVAHFLIADIILIPVIFALQALGMSVMSTDERFPR